ncbi:PDZ domain-containing protein [Maledivibacter halophilus]|uniref:PDZ domain-containing protein n=1 Tax=Maledivibacter halophilus TaxID=36842 RepID=A0A1T5JHY7_9FIRM|nr:hypothetical protein [Maledivibacter halophilus]SKC51049.1 hypothetical protein SAMN02194393_01202 [Maledivibacter halophilus]
MEWLELISLSLQSVLTIIINPLFWVVLFLIYFQYKKVVRMEAKLLGKEKATARERVLSSLGVGIIGGLLGTVVVSVLGVAIELEDFRFILPLAIFLMLINVRYLCFSYAGGILSISSLIFGFPKVNVSSIIALVAVLHLIESILIWIDGHNNPTPIFIEHDKYGTVGGFTLQRFWPIPFAVLLVVLSKLSGTTDINLPDWWPLFISRSLDVDNITLQLTVVIAALGYGDIAITSSPREKSKKSSLRLGLYSIILLILAGISSYIYAFKFIAAIFTPVAHEALIIYSQREEKNRMPIYKKHHSGLTVLDVKKDSIGEKMGIKPGFVILKANNYYINEKEELLYLLNQFPTYLWIEALDEKGNKIILEHTDFSKGINSIGTIVIPKSSNFVVSTGENVSIIKNLVKKIFKKR